MPCRLATPLQSMWLPPRALAVNGRLREAQDVGLDAWRTGTVGGEHAVGEVDRDRRQLGLAQDRVDVALDVGRGRFPVILDSRQRLESDPLAPGGVREEGGNVAFEFDPLGRSNTLLFEERNEDLNGKTVIILEDIIDTGNTLAEIYEVFRDQNVKQLKIATLFFKPDVFRKELPIDFIGKSIEDKFVVGYGLDYDGLGRNLPDLYQLAEGIDPE